MGELIIVSGGQTGVDQAAIRAACASDVPVEGWAPRGWRTERGSEPWLQGCGLLEHAGTYRDRTIANVELADAVLIIGRGSAGSVLTRNEATRLKKPWAWLWYEHGFEGHAGDQVVYLLDQLRPIGCRLLVAGNRESKNPGIGAAAERFIGDLIDSEVFGG